jgi:hypothetical protein
MADNRLYKATHLARRWVENMEWEQEGYWEPEPPTEFQTSTPSEPIGSSSGKDWYGWIGFPNSVYGKILDGMSLHLVLLGYDTNPPYLPTYFVYYE